MGKRLKKFHNHKRISLHSQIPNLGHDFAPKTKLISTRQQTSQFTSKIR